MAWQAIWNEGRVWRRPPPGVQRPLGGLTLALEIIGPRRPERPVPLRLWQGASGADDAISLYWMPDGALRLIHRHCDLVTESSAFATGETVSVTYVACRHGRHGRLEVQNHDRDVRHIRRTTLASTPIMSEALPRHPGFLGVAHMVAISGSAMSAEDPPGLESGAIVETPGGPRPIDTLRVGDDVVGSDQRSREIRKIEAWDRLCLGRQAPVRLRAPYFGLVRDVVVTPHTRLLQEGAVVEYLCGTDAVLAAAQNLINGKAVCRDRRQAVRRMYSITLETPSSICVNGCFLEASSEAGRLSSLLADGPPILDRAAARAVLSGFGRAA